MSDVAIEAMDTGEDFFLDSYEPQNGETPAQEPAQEPVEEKAEEPTPEGATPTEYRIKAKINHEEREFTESEAIPLIQKGFALDKTREELETLRNAREFKVLDAYAARNGMTREQYVDFLEKNEEENAVKAAQEQIRAKYAGISDDAAHEMAQLQVRQQAAQKQIDANSQEAQAQRAREQDSVQQWTEFLKEYPDRTTIDKIPQEVQEAVRNGARPLSAMQKYELEQARKEAEELRGKLQTQEQNQKNRQSAMGSVTDTRSAESFMDSFWSGYEGG